MTYIVFLKFFHFIAIFLAGGLGVANGMLTSAHQKAGTPPTEIVKNTMLRLARLGLVAILILWITGIALTAKLYGGFNVGWAFNIKLFGATILLAAIVFINCYLPAVTKKNSPPNSKIIKAIPMITRSSLVLVLLGIAITTSHGMS
jgi:hypothetical protein